MMSAHDSPRSILSLPIWFLCVLLAFSLAACPKAEEAPEEESDEIAEEVTEEAAEPEAPAEAPAGHLAVSALFARGGPPVDDVRFSLYRAEERVRGPTGNPDFDLPPGTYEVRVVADLAGGSETARVRSEERTEVEIVLNAGVLAAEVVLVEGGEPATDTRFRIFSVERDIRGERESIVGPTSRSSFVLPEGSYILQASEDHASVELEIKIEAGQRTEATVALGAGLLHASAFEEDGSAASGTLRWSLQSVEVDLRGQRENIVTPTRRNQFLLPAGEYLLRASLDERRAQERIVIEAGKRLDASITMPPVEDVVEDGADEE